MEYEIISLETAEKLAKLERVIKWVLKNTTSETTLEQILYYWKEDANPTELLEILIS